jgi:hypothetical protein
MEQKLEGHILNGRLNVEEKKPDDEMIRNMVQPNETIQFVTPQRCV